MAHQLFKLPRPTAISNNLTLVAGAKVGFFLTATSTPTDSYQDSALTTPHTNPVVADAAGRLPAIYLDPSIIYRITFTDSADVEIYPAIDPANDQVISQAIIGGYLYPRTDAEISAGVTPTTYIPILIPDIERYGASPAASAATNTAAIQAAINANYGKTLRIPYGTYQVATTGNTTAPVGDALTITDEITLILEGQLLATNNCNVIHINAGSQDVVTILEEGSIRGYGTFFELTNRNGSNIKVTSGIARVFQIRLIDPPQYGLIAEGADEGHVADVAVVGGQATYPGDNNYAICLVDAALGWKVDGMTTVANALGGKCSQAVASITLGTGTADRTQVINCRLYSQWEKGTYLIADDCQINNNFVYSASDGEGLRAVGKRTQVNNNKIRSCSGGGITLYDCEGAQCVGNEISDYRGAGITVGYAGSSSGKSLSRASVRDNKLNGLISGANLVAGIDVRGDSAAATTERRIEVVGNEISVANYSLIDERAGIHILPNHGSTAFQDLRVEYNTVNDTGSYGIRFGAGTYNYCRLVGNKVRDPGAQSVGLGGNRSAYRWDASVTWTGGHIKDNEARSETAGSGMSYGFDNQSAANIQSALVQDNHVRGHVTAGYLNMFHASNTTSGNRIGDNSLHGTLACTAAASFVITNSNAQTGMRVTIRPTNASAQVLQAGNDGLIFDGTLVAGTSFTLKTGAGGNAAGTETYSWLIEV